ncbi:MAG: Gfo/Idh/MocA family oxidoreductase [Clostridiales bacterium]|nr:Gfo/Idh/MocA family oxidoreductase [Clostridiales bacterium]
MNKIGTGIIGLGAIGERLINTFIKNPRTNIVGVYDVDTNRMKEISEKFDLPSVGSYEELINNDSIDMIYIAVPPKYHCEIALKVMKAGKHVLCEKPLASSIDEAKKMLSVANESRVVHGMNFPLYYGYAYNQIKKILTENTLGNLKRIELTAVFPVWPRTWQQNNWINTKEEGGFVREVFTHFVQLIQSSFGEINNLQSFVEYSDNPLESETGIVAIGELENNLKLVFNGLTGVNQKEELKLTIYGENGSVEMLNWRDLFMTLNGGEKTLVTPEAVDATYELIDAFYNAIDGKSNNLVTFEDGYHTTKIVEMLLKD